MQNNLVELNGPEQRGKYRRIGSDIVNGKRVDFYHNKKSGHVSVTLDGCPVALNGPILKALKKVVTRVRTARAERQAAGRPASKIADLFQTVGSKITGAGNKFQYGASGLQITGGDSAPADVYQTSYGPERAAQTPAWLLPAMMGFAALMIMKK